MNGLLRSSKDEKMPIEIMYISEKGEISHRTIVVKEILDSHIKAFCLSKQKPRIFNKSNILSAAKTRIRNKINYA
ncbi:hypothetical protein ACUIJN_11990 [Metabacillus halosaccharovorans]|uniref:hypothetical protein n=1 Tax=Metabacillus halosaccharovorans TaxID=930124 RepID=UPI00403D946A